MPWRRTDWTFLNDGLDAATVDRGVTTGVARPPGGGSFVFGFNSLATAQGAVGLFTNQVNFAPMAKGGSVRGALQRGPSGGPLNFAPFLFVGLQGPSVNDSGYLLGLADGDPHHIVLRKGALAGGLPDIPPGTQGVLRRSTGTFVPGTWLHLRGRGGGPRPTTRGSGRERRHARRDHVPFGAGSVSQPLASAGSANPPVAPAAPWRPTPLFLDPLVSRVDEQFRRAGELEPGHGKIDLFGYLQPDRMGGTVDYSHRITKSLSAFGEGWAGVARDPFNRWQADYGALGGLRLSW